MPWSSSGSLRIRRCSRTRACVVCRRSATPFTVRPVSISRWYPRARARGSRSWRRSFSSRASTRSVGLFLVVAGAGGADDRGQLHDACLHGGAVSALAGDQDVVAVVGGADADRLQATVDADRVRELLELAIVCDLAARVERLGDGLSRDHAEGGFRGGSENGQHAGWLRSGSSPDKRVRAERGAARRAERVAACAPLAGAGCSHVRKGGTA